MSQTLTSLAEAKGVMELGGAGEEMFLVPGKIPVKQNPNSEQNGHPQSSSCSTRVRKRKTPYFTIYPYSFTPPPLPRMHVGWTTNLQLDAHFATKLTSLP